MKSRLLQYFMLTLLLIIIIGGLFFPLLGYLVLAMMLFFMTLSYFKARYWCWYLCPRGAFLEVIVGKVSFRGNIPKVFTRTWFRYTVFTVIIGTLISRLILSKGDIYTIGYVFVTMCLVTTILAILVGIPTKPRSWCLICPMGTMQECISGLNKKPKKTI